MPDHERGRVEVALGQRGRLPASPLALLRDDLGNPLPRDPVLDRERGEGRAPQVGVEERRPLLRAPAALL